MSNPTSNFGWQMPTSTDLVTDLPADFEVFGQAVDTSLADLKGGTTGQVLAKATNADMDFTWVASTTGDITGVTAGTGISGGGTSGDVTITNSMATAIDAKGDLIAGTGADAFSRLAVGTNGQVLTADSAESTGMKWATAASGGMTLISQQSMSGSSTIQWTSIPNTYKHLLVTVNGYDTAGQMYTRLNAVTGSSYYNNTFGFPSTEFYASGNISNSANSNFNNLVFWVYNYAATGGFKLCEGWGYMRNNSGSDTARDIRGFLSQTTGAITSVQLTSSSGNFTLGTANLWGVS